MQRAFIHVRGFREVANGPVLFFFLLCGPSHHISSCLFHNPHLLHLCFSTIFLALLPQQAQPASQQWAKRCPTQQCSSVCDPHPCLPGRPWLPNDDDPPATVALSQFATGTCLHHTVTGRGHNLCVCVCVFIIFLFVFLLEVFFVLYCRVYILQYKAH